MSIIASLRVNGGVATGSCGHAEESALRISSPCRQRLEEVGQLGLLVPPAADGAAVDRLSHLTEAGCVDRPGVTVKLQAGRLPIESAGFEKTPRDALEIVDRFFVLDVVNRCWQDR